MKAQQALAFVENALDGLNRETLEGAAASLAAEVRRLRDEANGLAGSLDRAESVLQNLMSYLSVNGCRTGIDPENAELRIRDGIDMLVRPVLERAERAEAELKAAREQEPVAWKYKDEPWFDGSRWRDSYAATVSYAGAVFKDKDAIPLYQLPISEPAPAVPDGCAIVSRNLDPEAWKRLCNADIWPVTPKSFQRMLDVLMEVAMLQSAGGGK